MSSFALLLTVDPAAAGPGIEAMCRAMQWRSPCPVVQVVLPGLGIATASADDVHVDDDVAVVVDGRIDDLGALRQVLGQTGTRAAVVGAAFRRWGTSAPAHLDGAFAGVYIDRRSRTAFAFRDRLGVRPVFLAANSRGLACGSTADAVLESALLDRHLDVRRVIDHVAGHQTDPISTSFHNIRRVAPGTVVRADRGLFTTRYWSPPHAVDPSRGSEQTAAALREVLFEAVSRRVGGPGRTAAHLSGGLDSSSITAVARTLDPGVETISMRFHGRYRGLDEGEHISSVRRRYQGTDHEIDGSAQSTLSTFMDIAPTWSEPAIAPNHQFNLAMFDRLGEIGVVRCVDGFDGDSAISHGWGRFFDMTSAGDWDAWASTAADVARIGVKRPSELVGLAVPALIDDLRRGRVLACGAAMRHIARASGLPVAEVNTAVIEELKRRIRLSRPARAARQYVPLSRDALDAALPDLVQSARSEAGGGEVEQHRRTLTDPLMGFALEILDHHSARAGVESVHPFLETSVIELMVATDGRQKLRGGWPRRPLRDAMEGLLPEEIRWRTDKADFEQVFFDNLIGRDAPLARALVEDELWRLAPIVDTAAVQKLAHDTLERRRVIRRDAYALWRVTAALAWLTVRKLSL